MQVPTYNFQVRKLNAPERAGSDYRIWEVHGDSSKSITPRMSHGNFPVAEYHTQLWRPNNYYLEQLNAVSVEIMINICLANGI